MKIQKLIVISILASFQVRNSYDIQCVNTKQKKQITFFKKTYKNKQMIIKIKMDKNDERKTNPFVLFISFRPSSFWKSSKYMTFHFKKAHLPEDL